jgi:hypothetical protein
VKARLQAFSAIPTPPAAVQTPTDPFGLPWDDTPMTLSDYLETLETDIEDAIYNLTVADLDKLADWLRGGLSQMVGAQSQEQSTVSM